MDILLDLIWVFVIGGFVCMLGQILILKTAWTPARILVSFVVLGVALQAFKLFDPIKDVAGCGITVPIVGFGAGLAKGAIEAVKRNGFVGIFTGGLDAVAGGVAAAVVFAFIVALIARSKSKT